MRFSTATSVILSLSGLAMAQLPAIDIIKQIAPGSASCADSTDCRTSQQAAPYIAGSMFEYGIFSVNEMAAVISLMAFESGDFKYKHNVYPGRPGQGTANMQMSNYNLLYAKSIPAISGKVAKYSTTSGLSDADLNSILALVTDDKYNFGSGAWFLTTQCPMSVRTSLQSNADSGFQAYMQCVGASVTPDRLEYFSRAKKAFGIN
ncbi:hypothetical protein PT974_03816 [Cladobotryum mycophilum]|uniref:Uncharacterized protein n=1 Tax=Cladobotryum mycophilum TaxID=491253 RepID=A0ABR0STD2_9HYPO